MNHVFTEIDKGPAARKLRQIRAPLRGLSHQTHPASANVRLMRKARRNKLSQPSVAPLLLPRRPDASFINETIPMFYIGQNKAGLWVARESPGRCGGAFLLSLSALRFAR